jgi:hypothetical protein
MKEQTKLKTLALLVKTPICRQQEKKLAKLRADACIQQVSACFCSTGFALHCRSEYTHQFSFVLPSCPVYHRGRVLLSSDERRNSQYRHFQSNCLCVTCSIEFTPHFDPPPFILLNLILSWSVSITLGIPPKYSKAWTKHRRKL